MSDYLANIVTRNLNQNHGFRFAPGDLRPRLASRFEPPVNAWPEPEGLFEEEDERAGGGADPAVESTPRSSYGRQAEIHERRPLGATYPGPAPWDQSAPLARSSQRPARSGEVDQADAPDPAILPPLPAFQQDPNTQSAEDSGREFAARPQPPTHENVLDTTSTAFPAILDGFTAGFETATETSSQSRTRPPNLASQPEQPAADPVRAKPAVQSRAAPASVSRLNSPPLPEITQYEPGERSATQRPIELTGPDQRPALLLGSQMREASLPGQRPEPATMWSPDVEAAAPAEMPAPEQLSAMRQTLARIRDWHAENEAPAAAPTVNVTIGRIEVRAAPSEVKTAQRRSTTPVLTLEEYMRRRAGGGGL